MLEHSYLLKSVMYINIFMKKMIFFNDSDIQDFCDFCEFWRIFMILITVVYCGCLKKLV